MRLHCPRPLVNTRSHPGRRTAHKRLIHLNEASGDAIAPYGASFSMNRRLGTILLLAFLVAGGASYVVYRLVGADLTSMDRGRTVQVIVAAHDLPVGSLIKSGDVKPGNWVGDPPKGVVVKPEAAVGRGVVATVYENELIVESRLAPVGSGAGLAAMIKLGMRACAVKVNEVVGVAGFVTPGMRVDVLVSGSLPGPNQQTEGPRVRTILQNIEVLSAGTDVQRDNAGKPVQVPVVNLLVTPAQAEVLSLASNETKIQLVLRNPIDNKLAKPPGAEMASLFGIEKPPAPMKVRTPAPRPKRAAPVALSPMIYMVEVMNGSKHSEEKFISGKERQ